MVQPIRAATVAPRSTPPADQAADLERAVATLFDPLLDEGMPPRFALLAAVLAAKLQPDAAAAPPAAADDIARHAAGET